VFETSWGAVRICKLLQHGSTFAGLGLLAWAAYRSAPGRFVLSVSRGVGGAGLLVVALALAVGLARAWGLRGLAFVRALVGSGILAGFAVLLAMLTLYGLFHRLTRQCGT
jgi:hypothetical protein